MKKISSVVAAIAAVLLSVFAFAPAATAADYSATINSQANEDGTVTVTVVLDESTVAAGYEYVGARVNSEDVGNVSLAAEKTYGWWKTDSARTVKIKLTTLNCNASAVHVLAAKDSKGTNAITVGTTTVRFPATCKVSDVVPASTGNKSAAGTTEGNALAKTGATVMPYAVAALLLAGAGAAILALRKNASR